MVDATMETKLCQDITWTHLDVHQSSNHEKAYPKSGFLKTSVWNL
jgi:hypothetical protein